MIVDFKIMLLLPRLFSCKILMMTTKHGDNGAELAGICRSQSVFKDTASAEAQSHTRSDSRESANERLGKGSSAENRTTGASVNPGRPAGQGGSGLQAAWRSRSETRGNTWLCEEPLGG